MATVKPFFFFPNVVTLPDSFFLSAFLLSVWVMFSCFFAWEFFDGKWIFEILYCRKFGYCSPSPFFSKHVYLIGNQLDNVSKVYFPFHSIKSLMLLLKNVQLWRRKWQPIPVFLPGQSHGQTTVWGHKSLTQLSD